MEDMCVMHEDLGIVRADGEVCPVHRDLNVTELVNCLKLEENVQKFEMSLEHGGIAVCQGKRLKRMVFHYQFYSQ